MNDPAPAACTEGVRIRGDGYTAEAGWFGPEDRPRFGWLYRPDVPAPNGVGIVIVPPFGFEAVCAHRSLRRLAEEAAKTGFVAARFDLDGTGDSAGSDSDPERVTKWIASILDACDLARSAGASQLVLLGVRLGAALAVLAAPSRLDVAALIAINGVVRGRDFLREARALQAAIGLRPPPEPLPDDGSQEINGFVVTAETHSQLSDIDISQPNTPPAPHVLLVERDDMPERKRWPEHLRNLGVNVELQRVPGLVEMLDVPHLARIPRIALDACVAYLHKIAIVELGATAPRTTTTLRPAIRISNGSPAIREQAVLIDDSMFGILTLPESTKSQPGIALFNAGAVKHTGPNRMYVTWARHWATRCRRVLRVDLSGIGDSITRNGATENQVYGEHGITDAACATAWLEQHCSGRILAGGACAGAYHALRAASTGTPIDSLLLINPLAMQYIGSIANAATELSTGSYYSNQIKGGRAWRKLLTGRVSPRKLVRVAHWYTLKYATTLAHETLRVLHLPRNNDLGGELQALAARGVEMHFVFSGDDHSRALLVMQAGSAVTRLTRQGHVHKLVIDGPDHTFTQRWAQQALSAVLEAIIFREQQDA